MLTLTSVSPRFGADNLGSLVLTLIGTGVTGSEVVSLTDGSNPDIMATSPVVVDAQTLKVTVNLSGKPAGFRSVVVV